MPFRAVNPYRFAFAGLIGMAAAQGIGRFVYTPILPSMMQELGLSPSDAGLIASANYLGYLIGAVAAAGGWAAGRERMLMLCGLGAGAALAAAMGLTESTILFALIRFLAGMASAFVMVFLASIVFSHLLAEGREDLQAIHFSGVGAGIVASAVMMLALAGMQAHWQAGWFWASILTAAAFAAIAMMIDRGPVVAASARIEPGLPRSRPLVGMIVAYGFFGLGYVVTATFLVAIVRQGESSHVFEAVVWLVTGVVIVPSVFLWNRIGARFGLVATYAIGCLVEAVGVVATVTVPAPVGALLGAVLFGGTFVGVTALGLQATRMMAPESPRRVFALMTAGFGIGQIVGPVLAGFAAELGGGYGLPSACAALMLVISAAIAWFAAAPKSP